jgi:hypothetical protein
MAGLQLDLSAGMEPSARIQEPITELILQKSASLVNRNSSIRSRKWGTNNLQRYSLSQERSPLGILLEPRLSFRGTAPASTAPGTPELAVSLASARGSSA